MKKSNLLVAIDLSKSSFDVLEKSVELGLKHRSALDVVHILEDSFFSRSKKADEIFDNTYKNISNRFPTITREHLHIKNGDIKSEIPKLAKELDSELLIIGSSGESILLEEIFLGSNTKDIVRSSKIPVLVLKNYHELKYRNILAPTDFTKESKESLKELLELFPYSNIILYHTYSTPFEGRLHIYGFDSAEVMGYKEEVRVENEHRAREFIAEFGENSTRMRSVVCTGSLNPKIFMENIEELNADLIFLHTTGNFSFITFDLLEASTLDVLVVSV